MFHGYQYVFTDGVHCYEFSALPIRLTLTPSTFITTDLSSDLNILCIELVRLGDKIDNSVGETICYFLEDFMENNRHIALGYYPSFTDNKENCRIRLFNYWANKFIFSKAITRYNNSLYFPGENNREELILQVFVHDDYPNREQLFNGLKSFSDNVAAK